jgi:hypothetical protein
MGNPVRILPKHERKKLEFDVEFDAIPHSCRCQSCQDLVRISDPGRAGNQQNKHKIRRRYHSGSQNGRILSKIQDPGRKKVILQTEGKSVVYTSMHSFVMLVCT